MTDDQRQSSRSLTLKQKIAAWKELAPAEVDDDPIMRSILTQDEWAKIESALSETGASESGRIKAVLDRHTPFHISDEKGARDLSPADRLELWERTLSEREQRIPEEINEWINHMDLHLIEHDDRHRLLAYKAAWPHISAWLHASRSMGAPSEDTKDAARYRWLRDRVKAQNQAFESDGKFYYLLLPHLLPLKGMDLMRGSIQGHLDTIIDDLNAPRAERKG